MPVKIFYLIDSVRCKNPNTYLSNILFARIKIFSLESIEYRMKKYEFVVLLNKSDAVETDELLKWLKDYELFLDKLNEQGNYLSTLSKSIVINLSDFYEKLKVEKLSAKTGFGFQELHKYIQC